ncbi:1-acyl-sn-glycerol-3-phosphate acyltransferase [Candidatus Woesearchaeota archaeon]|nr:1-acyl-sn-glycerol-3-phosphate acyltransferase [Candidatus Woesearchaeota archaeon]
MVNIIKKIAAYVIYYILWIVNTLIISFFYRPSIKGMENFPRKGPLLIACNHEDNSDIMFLSFLTYRRLYFLAHSGLFRKPARSRFFMKLFDQIQTAKGQSTNVVNKSVSFLKEDKIVAIFPEGTIDGGKTILKGHTGVARIAILSGVKVLPIAVVNSYGIMPRGRRMLVKIEKVNINIGKPMTFNEHIGKHENRKITRKATNKIMNEIKRLYKEA